MKLAIKALSPLLGKEIPLPFFATPGAAAMDLHACLEESLTLAPRERRIVPTGLAVAIPAGFVGIGLLNTTDEPYTILPGDRIAQLMVIPVTQPTLEMVEQLPETERGAGGFGSTGR